MQDIVFAIKANGSQTFQQESVESIIKIGKKLSKLKTGRTAKAWYNFKQASMFGADTCENYILLYESVIDKKYYILGIEQLILLIQQGCNLSRTNYKQLT